MYTFIDERRTSAASIESIIFAGDYIPAPTQNKEQPLVGLRIEPTANYAPFICQGAATRIQVPPKKTIHPWDDILEIDKQKPFLAMYRISSRIDSLLSQAQFIQIERDLNSFDITEASVELLVSILSTTAAAKSRLPARERFFNRVSMRVHSRGEFKVGLLDGLE